MFKGISFYIDGFSAPQKNKLKKIIAENGGTVPLVLKKNTTFVVSEGKTRHKLLQAKKYGIPILKQLFVEACIIQDQILYDLHARECISTFEFPEGELVWSADDQDFVDLGEEFSVTWEYDTESSSSDPQITDSVDTDFLLDFAGVADADWGSDTSSKHEAEDLEPKPPDATTRTQKLPIHDAILSHLSFEGNNVELWVCGDNSKGQLATGNREFQFYPRFSAILSNIVYAHGGAQMIAVGYDHVALLSKDGVLCTWGSGKQGQLGHKTKTWPAPVFFTHAHPPSFTPVRITPSPRITHVACGSGMTVCVDSENRVWSWGSKKFIGRAYGTSEYGTESIKKTEAPKKLHVSSPKGISHVKHKKTPTIAKAKKLKTSSDDHKLPEKQATYFKIPGIVDFPTNVAIAQVCCGESHTIIRGVGGKVYGWGANEMGQLGIHKQKLVSYPVKIDIEGVVSVSCGKDFSMFVGKNALYSCGNNCSGQLGRATNEVTDASILPTEKVIFSSNIMQVSCGEAHAACLLKDGTVWLWGCAANQRLGPQSSMDVRTPMRLCIFDKHQPFVYVACGATYTYVVTQNGQTLTVGEGGIMHNDELYDALDIECDKFSKNRVLLADVHSIFCGKGKFSFFATDMTSPVALHQHAVYGNSEIIEHHSRTLGSVDLPPQFSCVFGDTSRTALECAVLVSQKEVVKTMLENGIPLQNYAENAGPSALHIAAMRDDIACLQLLAEACNRRYSVELYEHSPINLVTKSHGSPLHICVANFSLKGCRVLLRNNAFKNIADAFGRTPLHHALINAPTRNEFIDLFGERRDFRIVQLLVKSGASITIPDEDGNTPLSFATEDEMKLVEEWANDTDILLIAEKYDEHAQMLELYFTAYSFICKCIRLESKSVTRENIAQAKCVCFYAPDTSYPCGTSWQEAADLTKEQRKFTISAFATRTISDSELRTDGVLSEITKYTILPISDPVLKSLMEEITPIISKITHRQKMKKMEERLHQMVNLSIEEILRNRLQFLDYPIFSSYEEDDTSDMEDAQEQDIHKEVRLFLSSTFRDMFHEREQLVKLAFPELALYCHQNSLFFTEVDLRWGITAAQASQGEVLNICLGEVDRCRPFFCCILGERYGWYSNPAKPDPLLQRTFEKAAQTYPWITNFTDRSVTELEIQHAVLNNPTDTSVTARFYFKDPNTFEKKQEVKAPEPVKAPEVEETKPLFEYAYTYEDFGAKPSFGIPVLEEAKSSFSFGSSQIDSDETATKETVSEDVAEKDSDASDELAKRKLEELKQRIIDAGCSVQYYSSPAELASMIEKDFKEAIDHKFISGDIHEISAPTKSPLDAEIALHHAYAVNKARFFAGREKYLSMLEEYVTKTEPLPFVVANDAGGTGQSSLLAKFALNHAADNPSDIIITHFISASSDSSEISNIQTRLLYEIRKKCGIAYDLPGPAAFGTGNEFLESESNPTKLLEALESLLGLVANKLSSGQKRNSKKLLIIIDGLHVVDQNSSTSLLSVLPHSFPACVRAIFSTQAGTASLDICRKRKYTSVALPPLKPVEMSKMIENFLGHYCKSLSPSQSAAIISKEACTSPLFLRTILEELRIFGVFEELTKHINDLLTSSTIDKLYKKIFNRLESDLGTVKELFKSVLTSLWAARDGLSMTEMKELLRDKKHTEQDWKQAFHAIQRFIVNVGGFEALASRHIHQAIENQYLESANDKKNVHQMLANFFASQPGITVRTATQLPYHYLHANNTAMLKAKLSNLEIFRILISDETLKPKLLAWWRAVPGGYSASVEAYEQSLSQYIATNPPGEEKFKTVYKLAQFFKEIHDYKRAEAFVKRAINIAEMIYANQPAMADVLVGLVGITSSRYTFAGVEEEQLLKQALAIRKATLGEASEPVAQVLELLGRYYRARREYYSSELHFQQSIKIKEKLYGPDHPSLADPLTGMAWIYQRQHKFKLAIQLGAKIVDILETAYGSSHPEVALGYTTYGLLLNSQDQMTKASTFLKLGLTISEQLLGKESKSAHQLRKYLVDVYEKMKKTEEIKPLLPLIAQYEEEEDTGPQATTGVEQSDEDIKKVVKVTMGNDLELLDVDESHGKTPGEVQKNRNRWTVFVRSPDPDFDKCISTVEFRFHQDWTTRGPQKVRLDSNIVRCDKPPFEFSSTGWPPIHGLPKDHREDLFKIAIVITFNPTFKSDPMVIPYELVLPIKTEMATTETTGNGREIAYEFVQEYGKAFLVQFLGKSAAERGGWIDRL